MCYVLTNVSWNKSGHFEGSRPGIRIGIRSDTKIRSIRVIGYPEPRLESAMLKIHGLASFCNIFFVNFVKKKEQDFSYNKIVLI